MKAGGFVFVRKSGTFLTTTLEYKLPLDNKYVFPCYLSGRKAYSSVRLMLPLNLSIAFPPFDLGHFTQKKKKKSIKGETMVNFFRVICCYFVIRIFIVDFLLEKISCDIFKTDEDFSFEIGDFPVYLAACQISEYEFETFSYQSFVVTVRHLNLLFSFPILYV